MYTFLIVLIPILILIVLGFGLQRSNFLPKAAWAGMEKLTYYILFPALLIRTLANQRVDGLPWLSMLTVIILALIAVSLLLIVWHRLFKSVSSETFTSVFQGGVRFNTYIALACAQGFFGEKGLALAVVAAGFMIVLINLLCISAFLFWGKVKTNGIQHFLRELLGNPLIIACSVGWVLSLSGVGLPDLVESTFKLVGRAALPFGLLAVGAALVPEAVRGHLKPILISSAIQFVMKPLLIVFLAMLTGLTGTTAANVLLIAFVTPTAPSAYILSRQLGGDAETMASIITFQTFLAFLMMPLMMYLFILK